MRLVLLLAIACLAGSAAPAAGPSGGVSDAIAAARLCQATGTCPAGEKIMGGTRAARGDNPWQVALILSGPPDGPRILFCGGMMVAPHWVLTAAHCVDTGTPAAAVDIVSGALDLSHDGRRLAVTAIHIDPGYDKVQPHANDVALLEIAGDMGADARPVPLAIPSDAVRIPPHFPARVTGWGATAPDGGAVRDLRTLDVAIVSDAYCNDPVAYDGAIGPTMICAASSQPGRDSCQGDSGGPLTGMLDGKRVLVGVVSWGEGCAKPDKYGVYARITALPWIGRCMADKARCDE